MGASKASLSAQICFSVRAGLPAMQTPRYIRHTPLMPSQASQLPQKPERKNGARRRRFVYCICLSDQTPNTACCTRVSNG
ncbi:hypothetical protein F7R12_04080 [Pseudomonas tolaasii]|nr:hypothetical protein F7R12_04080 [Pseudomonas tolaasii]